jgi:hypothetical protein
MNIKKKEKKIDIYKQILLIEKKINFFFLIFFWSKEWKKKKKRKNQFSLKVNLIFIAANSFVKYLKTNGILIKAHLLSLQVLQ